MVRDMTEGKPLRLILAFGIPLLIGNLFQQLYNMVDAVIVGRFVGAQALAAVGATGSLSFLVIGFVLGMCSGFSIPVAQAFGGGDLKRMRRYVVNSLYLSVVVIVLLTLVTMLYTREILRIMQTPEDIFSDSYAYIIVIFAGIFAAMFYNLLASIMRALGDSRTPLYFLMISSVINIVLDLTFVVGFHAGVSGAAYATVIAQTVSGLLCFFYMRRHYPVLLTQPDELKPDRTILLQLLKNGLPMALQFSITAVGAIVLQSAVNSLGSSIVAAVTVAGKVQMLATQPIETLGATMATYCGQNLGAGKIDRVRHGVRQAVLAGTLYCALAWGVVSFLGTTIAQLFISGSEVDILAHVGQFLRTNSIFYVFLALLLVLRNSIQGLGYALPAMAAGAFEMVARALVGFCLVGLFQFNAVCFANPTAWISANLLLVPVYLAVIRKLCQRYPSPAPVQHD